MSSGKTEGASARANRRKNLWKPETHVLIVGYQSQESLGRRLVEGADLVRIHGEKVAVAAEVHTLGGFSAHAGQTDLLNWFSAIAPSKPRVIQPYTAGARALGACVVEARLQPRRLLSFFALVH